MTPEEAARVLDAYRYGRENIDEATAVLRDAGVPIQEMAERSGTAKPTIWSMINRHRAGQKRYAT